MFRYVVTVVVPGVRYRFADSLIDLLLHTLLSTTPGPIRHSHVTHCCYVVPLLRCV